MLWALLLIPAWSSALGTDDIVPYERSITRNFKVSAGATVNIDNKYGNVTLHAWAKNEINAVITIKVDGNSPDAAKQLADQVSIRGAQAGNTVSLATEYDAGSGNSFWKQFFGGGPKTGKKYIHIDYKVYIPQSLADLQITNNYGNVTGDHIPGNMKVNMNYGAFHISNQAGTLSIAANYCQGSLNGIKTGRIQANYTDFSIDKAGDLDIRSNYSDFKIITAGNIHIQGNYGDITGETIASIDGETTYSDYKISKLTSGGSLNTTYGDVYIKNLGDQFRGLTVRPTYSDVKIGVPDNLSLRIDVGLTRGDISTGSLPLQITEHATQHGNSTLKATMNGAGNNAPEIKIVGTYSDLTLRGE